MDVTESDCLFQKEIDCFVDALLDSLPTTQKQLLHIRQHQQEDEVCQTVASYCQSGWQEKHRLSDEVRPYYSVSSETSVEQGPLLLGGRIIIPLVLRKEMLGKVHKGHLGIVKEQGNQSGGQECLPSWRKL